MQASCAADLIPALLRSVQMSYNASPPDWSRRGPPSSGAAGYGQPPPPPGGPPAAGRGSGSLGGQVSCDTAVATHHVPPATWYLVYT